MPCLPRYEGGGFAVGEDGGSVFPYDRTLPQSYCLKSAIRQPPQNEGAKIFLHKLCINIRFFTAPFFIERYRLVGCENETEGDPSGLCHIHSAVIVVNRVVIGAANSLNDICHPGIAGNAKICHGICPVLGQGLVQRIAAAGICMTFHDDVGNIAGILLLQNDGGINIGEAVQIFGHCIAGILAEAAAKIGFIKVEGF